MMEEAQAVRQQAYEHFSQGNFEEALQLFRQLETEAEDAELANDIAVVLYRLGQTEKAVEKFRHSLSLGGGDFLAVNAIEILDEQVKSAAAKKAAPVAAPAPAPVSTAPSAFDQLGRSLTAQALEIWRKDSPSALHRAGASLGDEEWFNVLLKSVDDPVYREHFLPGFISATDQAVFVGSSGVAALQEAMRFMRVVLKYARQNGIAFDDKTKIADFGSGWGRYTRFLLKYASPDNIYGLEVNKGMVEHCRKAFGLGNFLKVEAFPPCDLRDGLLDLTFGYSVLSHLSPDCANAWIEEFARITRPGGLVMMTTQGRSFIDYCADVRRRNDRSNEWFVSLINSFVDVEASYRDYDNGVLLHAGFGQYGGTYGETLVPKGHIEKHWLKYFDLVDFVDSRSCLPQALFVLRRNERVFEHA